MIGSRTRTARGSTPATGFWLAGALLLSACAAPAAATTGPGSGPGSEERAVVDQANLLLDPRPAEAIEQAVKDMLRLLTSTVDKLRPLIVSLRERGCS